MERELAWGGVQCAFPAAVQNLNVVCTSQTCSQLSSGALSLSLCSLLSHTHVINYELAETPALVCGVHGCGSLSLNSSIFSQYLTCGFFFRSWHKQFVTRRLNKSRILSYPDQSGQLQTASLTYFTIRSPKTCEAAVYSLP